jgi:RND superfamily putative drug exporter
MSVLTIVLLSIAITPIRNIVLEIPDVKSLPEKSEVRISYEKFEKTFLNENETIVPVVLYTKKPAIEEDSLKLIEQTVDKIKNKKNVKDVQYLFSVGKFDSDSFNKLYKNPIFQKRLQPLVKQFTSGNKALVYVTIDGAASSTKAKEWVKHLQEEKLPLKHSVGGYAKFNQEIFDEIYQKAPKGLLMILITTYIILLFAFRSIVIPFKAIVMNMFSLGAAFGIVDWIFQGGNLGVTESNIALMIPIMVFAIVFGLSMDYEVFLISRIQEEYKKTNNNNLATLDGLTTTSKIITSAAAIMIVVTGAFSFTDILPVKQVGIAVAFSIFIDATIIRMILVPSLMKLLGDWNWWMPFRKK